MRLAQFRRVVGQNPLDLPLAALLFARQIAYPSLRITPYLQQLDDLAIEAGRLISANDPLAVQAETLATFLFAMSGFRGNTADYGDDRNSYFNEVLERRLGIPISLSVLYMAIAGRLRRPAYGVGLPGHFIVGLQQEAGAEPILLDPYHAGLRLTPADCERLVATTTGYKGAFLPRWLDPSPAPLILTRMLNNLRLGYVAREQWDPAVRVLRHLQVVQPDAAEHVRDEGLIEFQRGNYQRSAERLDRYLQLAPEAADAETIRLGIAPKIDQWVRLN